MSSSKRWNIIKQKSNRTEPKPGRARTEPQRNRTRTDPKPGRARTEPEPNQTRTEPKPDRAQPNPNRTRTEPEPNPNPTEPEPNPTRTEPKKNSNPRKGSKHEFFPTYFFIKTRKPYNTSLIVCYFLRCLVACFFSLVGWFVLFFWRFWQIFNQRNFSLKLANRTIRPSFFAIFCDAFLLALWLSLLRGWGKEGTSNMKCFATVIFH